MIKRTSPMIEKKLCFFSIIIFTILTFLKAPVFAALKNDNVWNVPEILTYSDAFDKDKWISASGECQMVKSTFEVADTSDNFSVWWLDWDGKEEFQGRIDSTNGLTASSCTEHSFLFRPNTTSSFQTVYKTGSSRQQFVQIGSRSAYFSIVESGEWYHDFEPENSNNTFFGSVIPILLRLNSTNKESPEECDCNKRCFAQNLTILAEIKELYESGGELLVRALEHLLLTCPNSWHKRLAMGMLGHTLLFQKRLPDQKSPLVQSLPFLFEAGMAGEPHSQGTVVALAGMLGSPAFIQITTANNISTLPQDEDSLNHLLKVWLQAAGMAGDLAAETMLGFRAFHGYDSEEKNCGVAAKYYKQSSVKTITGAPLARIIEEVLLSDAKDRWRPIEIDPDEKVLLLDLANKGDAESMFQAGERYLFGEQGFPQDYNRAFQYYLGAQAQGVVEALHRLGVMSWHGMGVEANITRAMDEYFEKACALRNAVSCSDLGYLLSFGASPGKANYTRALTYFEKAANLGEANGFYYLGLMFLYGNPLPANLTKAYRYFDTAASMGHRQSLHQKGVMLKEGQGTDPDCVAAVLSWKLLVDLGPLKLGLENGRKHFLKKETETAVLHYGLAAEQGFLNAQKNMVWLLGSWVPSLVKADHNSGAIFKNSSSEKRYLEMAAFQNDSDSKFQLGEIYYQKWWKSSLMFHKYNNKTTDSASINCNDLQNVAHQSNVTSASIFLNKSVQYYSEAASIYHCQAMFNLAMMHYKGLGVDQNTQKALSLLHDTSKCEYDSFFPAVLALVWVHLELFICDFTNGHGFTKVFGSNTFGLHSGTFKSIASLENALLAGLVGALFVLCRMNRTTRRWVSRFANP